MIGGVGEVGSFFIVKQLEKIILYGKVPIFLE